MNVRYLSLSLLAVLAACAVSVNTDTGSDTSTDTDADTDTGGDTGAEDDTDCVGVEETPEAIGWKVDGMHPMPGYTEDSMGMCDLAGSPAQYHWNNAETVGQGPGTALSLVDSRGEATGAEASWVVVSGNSWGTDDFSTPPTPDERLMNSYGGNNPTITISDVPTAYQQSGYDVIVYLMGHVNTAVDLTVNGSELEDLHPHYGSFKTFGGSHVAHPGTGANSYDMVVFENLTASSVVVSVVANPAGGSGPTAIQLVRRTQ